MILNPADLLNPVFNALDALISNYGVYLYLVFVWLSLGAIAWVLGGGLRRKCIARLIRLRSTLHPPPGSGSFAFRFRAREDFSRSPIIWN
jgi:hypothetical protein